jgi:hypothetical protein
MSFSRVFLSASYKRHCGCVEKTGFSGLLSFILSLYLLRK